MIKKFIVNQVGKVVRSGGQIATEELAKARLEVCNGCDKIGKVGLKGYPLVSVEGCTICKCPLVTKTKTLTHRDYSNNIYKASKNLKNLIDILNKNNVPFVRTQCDLGKWLQTDINFLGIQRIIELDMATVKSIGDFGKERANPNASKNNTMRLDNLENKSLSSEDTITIKGPSGKVISSINFNGIDHPVQLNADDKESIQEILYDIVSQYENKVFVSVKKDDDSDTVIRHIGQLVLGSIKISPSTVIDASIKSTLVTYCTNVAILEAANANTPTFILFNKDGLELVNETLANDYSTVNETNRASLEDDLNSAISSFGKIDVSLSEGNYKIVLYTGKGFIATIAENEFIVESCKEIFI